jgi:hypothetical protein
MPGSRVAAHAGNHQTTPQGDWNEALTRYPDHGLIPQEEVVLRARPQNDSSGRIGSRGAGILRITGNLCPIRSTGTYWGCRCTTNVAQPPSAVESGFTQPRAAGLQRPDFLGGEGQESACDPRNRHYTQCHAVWIGSPVYELLHRMQKEPVL